MNTILEHKRILFNNNKIRFENIKYINELDNNIYFYCGRYYESGHKEYESLSKDIYFHNTYAAARIWYNPDGSVESKSYYLNGEYLENIKSDKELKQYIKLQNIL